MATTRTTRIETRKRGPLGWLFLVLFVAFNVAMLVSVYRNVSGASDRDSAEMTGAAFGFVGLLVLWLFGAVILGLFVLASRGRRTVVEEYSTTVPERQEPW